MKMTKDDFAALKAAIKLHVLDVDAGRIALSLIAEGDKKRQAWRVFYYVDKLENYALWDKLFAYLNDSHIETALIKILFKGGLK